jgi:hypothetical protein
MQPKTRYGKPVSDLSRQAAPLGTSRSELKTDSVRLKLKRSDLQRWTGKQSEGDHDITKKALFVRLEAKLGKENEVAKFPREGQGLVHGT